MSENVVEKPIYGEELLSNEGEKVPFVKEELVRKVEVELTGLKKIIKDQAEEELNNEIKFRGNDARVAKLIKMAKLEKKPALDIPPLPSQRRGGPGKSRYRGAISPTTALADSDQLAEYSYRDIMVERRKRMFLTALRSCGGNISKACYRAKITRFAVAAWAKKDELFREEMMQLSEAIVDAVEDALMERIANGDTYAIIFYLKTRGKHRGYTEKLEVEGPKDEFDHMSDEELLREHARLEAKITTREGDT